MILGHELAHIRRRDFLAGLVAELAVCLCWFHPLVRWLAGRLRLEQEYAADAWVASAAADPTDYVRCLARLALELDRGATVPWHPPSGAADLRSCGGLTCCDETHRDSPARLGKRAGWTVAVLAAAVCLAVGGRWPPALGRGRPKSDRELSPMPKAKRRPTGMATRCRPAHWPAWERPGCGTGPRSRSSPLGREARRC